MNNPWVLLILFIVGVLVYTGYRLRKLQQLSEQQWKDVDHSKLREWSDDE